MEKHANQHTLVNPEPQKRPMMLNPRRKKIGIILGSVIILVLLTAGIYVNSLFNLIKAPEYTGDPSLVEAQLIEDEEKVNLPDSTAEINKAAEEIAKAKKIDVPKDDKVRNILLIGTDNRGEAISGRSDTMMVLSVNKRTKMINLVSLARGLYVEIPGRGYGMLNAAYAYGGAPLLTETIENNLRIHIDNTVAINFAGFVKAIDLVEGLDIKLTAAEIAQMGKTVDSTGKKYVVTTGLIPGTNRLNGELALTYARLRKIDSDYNRTGRQRTVVESLIQKLTRQNAQQIDASARQLLPLVKTDMAKSDLVSLAVEGLQYRSYPIKQLMLPVDGTHRMIIVRGTQMESFDVETNVSRLHKQLYG